MLRKLNLMFRPDAEGKLGESGGGREWPSEGSGIRLVRSTSLYLIGESHQHVGSSLKRSQSAVSVDSSIYNIKAEDRLWMFSRTQDCLQYLHDLIILRQQYRPASNHGKSKDRPDQSSALVAPSKTSKKPSPGKHASKKTKDESNPAPAPTEAETLAYFDSVIAAFDQGNKSRTHTAGAMHIDVDFVIASSTSEHSLHSNWILKSPRRYSIDLAHLTKVEDFSRRYSDGMRMSFKRLERHPMYLPKLVESPIHTMRFKPKAHNEDDEL
ncbi:uncharacterized protein C13orf42 homolog [Amblyraja radiata]|uniref:uncharacterized protein C13orf42 homolog n=1 Tax=Amblyraja radiata TaxID=386614 RepID=UPI001401DF88|nr:uncharacterized protein C13orf42 homolog [Amblyraja radiata]